MVAIKRPQGRYSTINPHCVAECPLLLLHHTDSHTYSNSNAHPHPQCRLAILLTVVSKPVAYHLGPTPEILRLPESTGTRTRGFAFSGPVSGDGLLIRSSDRGAAAGT
jgi:hypothetical protein